MSNHAHSSRLAAAIAIAGVSQFSLSAAVLEEVIVTAQKRTQSLQDVPISVSAVSGEKIQEAGIYTMTALASHVPNLHIAEAPVNTNIYMRGVGSGNNQAFEQSVGMYIDGVYMGRGRQYRSPFMDVDRVEVLRGPQGTLFGKNTVAGAISVTSATAKLDEKFNGSVTVAMEQNDGKLVEGYLSGAVSDNFALRLAYKYRDTEGHIDNTFLNHNEPQVEESIYRLSAFWQVNDDMDVTLKYGHSNYDRVGQLTYVTDYLSPQEVATQFPNASDFANTAYAVTNLFFPQVAATAGRPFTAYRDNNYGNDRNSVSIGKNPDGSENENGNFSMTANLALGEFTLTSVTGYSAYEFDDGADVDWLPFTFISRDDAQEFDQISQEFRITSPTGEFFEYIAGVYYEEQELTIDRRVVIDGSFGGFFGRIAPVSSLFGALTQGLYGADQTARDHLYKLDTKSYAAFAQGAFNISEDFRLTLGLRFTEEDKDVVSRQFLSDDVTGIGVPSSNPFLASITGGAFGAFARTLSDGRSTSKWIPSANVQWDASPEDMFYFTISEGFKSGGFSSADNGTPTDIGSDFCASGCTGAHEEFEFEDEEVLAYEFGGKHELLDGAMTANWAAFRTEYDNQQVTVFKGVSFLVTNAAQSTIQGVEMDVRWQTSENLLIGASGAYLDAKYDKYVNAACTALQIDALGSRCGNNGENDLSGRGTTFSPDWSASVFFNYAQPVGDGLEFFMGGDMNYSDSFSTAGDSDPIDFQKSYTKFGLRTGLRDSAGTWEATLYGRNITDEEIAMIRFDVPVLAGSHAQTTDEGRVWGARIRYNF